MFKYPSLEPFNFLGLEGQNYNKARVVVFPVPYSSTTYWKSGTKDGPRAIIEASRHLELYDHETKRDLAKIGIFTLDELEPSKASPEETIARIKKVVAHIIKDKKFPIMLGGEHSITNGGVQAFYDKYGKDFSVLQIDAHTDSRYEFEGTKWHHACVMRRTRELGVQVTQVGIRSSSEEEQEYFKKEKINTIFYAPDILIGKIVSTLKKRVYITFDLDALDTSIMPSTGTPEPGGIGWYDVLALLKAVGRKRKIIGADVVELCPIPGLHAPDFLAAKLVYKLIQYMVG